MASDSQQHSFVKVPLDVDPDTREAEDFTVRRRQLFRRSVIGFAMVGLVALGTYSLSRGPQHGSTEPVDVDATVQAFAKPFAQCGGADYEGPTCCQKGCACILKSRFFSMCATPTGTGKCSVTAAQDEVELAKKRVQTAKESVPAFQSVADHKKKEVAPVRKAYEKAREPLEGLRSAGHKAHEAWMSAKRELADAKEEATEAATIADKAAKTYGDVKQHLDPFDKAEELNKGGQCATIGGQCGGQVAAQKACCIIGCVCHWENAYYGACRAPKGKETCDEAGWRAEEAETRKNATRLKKIAEKTGAEKDRTAQVLKEKQEAYDKHHKAAIKAGTKRGTAEHHARMLKHHLDQMIKKAEEAQAKADHAVHNVKFAAANVAIWKKVAGGHSCSDVDAAAVLEADPVDYKAISSEDSSGDSDAASSGSEDDELKGLDDDLDLDLDDSDLDEFEDATSV